MLEPYIKDQKITCLARSGTSNPNNGDLATHCHRSFARMNWKRRIHYNLWFLNKGWRIHLLSLLLYEEQALFLSLSYYIN